MKRIIKQLEKKGLAFHCIMHPHEYKYFVTSDYDVNRRFKTLTEIKNYYSL